MDATRLSREAEKKQLLRRLAELTVEEQREQGLYKSVPHYSQLEQAARSLGRELSCLTQERSVAETAAACATTAACPTCGAKHEVHLQKRTVTSVDGPVELVEPVAYCRPCRRSFFPSA
jgi:DNA repair exonuclease SbcCD ATPase subunit